MMESREKHDGEGVVAEEAVIGDITWVKLCSGSWWPALVVGGNSYGSNEDVRVRVRVRLYGSYEYILVDPTKWHSEFQIALNENNGCYQEILRKALEQDISSPHSDDQVRGKPSKSKGTSNKRVSQKRATPRGGNSSKKDGMQKKRNGSTQNEDGELSPELSARRIKVMQTLGLAAPCGSPFRN
ncbi:uncharacterized protein [Euphorbia lathyris]|uniref:uncharacterized protein n=1 Tax=Euphorbia lathyris TaxID=212925 RepID=UPI0033133913